MRIGNLLGTGFGALGGIGMNIGMPPVVPIRQRPAARRGYIIDRSKFYFPNGERECRRRMRQAAQIEARRHMRSLARGRDAIPHELVAAGNWRPAGYSFNPVTGVWFVNLYYERFQFTSSDWRNVYGSKPV